MTIDKTPLLLTPEQQIKALQVQLAQAQRERQTVRSVAHERHGLSLKMQTPDAVHQASVAG